ncbi:MAG: M16 family metallopeptidase [Bacteroidia bacterium]
MRKISLFFIVFAVNTAFAVAQQFTTITHTSPDGKYTYTTVSNDPLQVRTYKLKNGLTVMLSVNKKDPRIQTMIAVNAGSKNDPSDNTGLAHYLEHMLFKGTDKFGSKDWQNEKKYLEIIDGLYEQYNSTKDEVARKKIYREIDSMSAIASKYAIANEYDKMLQGIGAQGTNAFTSLEQTVYINDIPQNGVEKWLMVEAERFRNPILRLFHTELEAVYEEKNISLDNDGRKIYEAVLAGLFKNHTYGTQTTIGTVEHLKNPSLIKIRNYYNTYYVPNNMAIIMSGDLDPDQTIKLIDEHFGYMQPKHVPQFTFMPEKPRISPEIINVYGPDAENLLIGFRFPGAGTKEARLLTVVDMLLSNSKAGLIDLNLTKKQAVLSAGSMTWINKDYSMMFLTGRNKKNQSLEQVKDLLIGQLDKIKKGDFSESTLKAIIANLKVEKIKEQESNQGRAYAMLESFNHGRNWVDAAADLDEMAKFTKNDVMAFAKQYFTNDYVIVYKRTGEDKNIQKIEKPEITPVDVNREDVSPFVQKINSMKVPPIQPRFINFEKEITLTTLGNVPVYYIKNTNNALFSLYYVLDMGKFNDLKLPIAVNLLQFLGTDKYTPEQISMEFFNLACDYGVNVGNEQVYVYLSGLTENFDKALQLFEHLLLNAKPDQNALNSLVERTLKSRADSKKNKGVIFWQALQNYAAFGSKNPFTHNLTEAELKALKADDLVNNYIKKLTSYKHKIWYYGPEELPKVNEVVKKWHKTPSNLLDYPKAIDFIRVNTDKNKVIFVKYDMVQAEVMWLYKSLAEYNPEISTVVTMFNEYFGGGMSSIVFQTIRESKALAYSTNSTFISPSKKNEPYYMRAYVGTQADKLFEAVPAMNELLNNLPKADNMFEDAKSSLANSIETQRLNGMEIIFEYERLKKLGLNQSVNERIYNELPSLKFNQIEAFHAKYIKGKPFTYCIMGSDKRIDINNLKKFGEVTEVSLEELFGY